MATTGTSSRSVHSAAMARRYAVGLASIAAAASRIRVSADAAPSSPGNGDGVSARWWSTPLTVRDAPGVPGVCP